MTPGGRRITLVAAVAENGVIGADGAIPWHLPADFAHFKALTTGHVLLMGRATWDSIGRPLPDRETLVLTRDDAWSAPGAHVAHDLPAALEHADRLAAEIGGEVMVVGGAGVYAATLPWADRQVLTRVPGEPAGDAVYPAYDPAAWTEVRRDQHGDFAISWLEPAASAAGAAATEASSGSSLNP